VENNWQSLRSEAGAYCVVNGPDSFVGTGAKSARVALYAFVKLLRPMIVTVMVN
jgi:hypothetical protein